MEAAAGNRSETILDPCQALGTPKEKRAALVVTWWYWVSIGWYWLALGDTGSKQRGTGCQCDILTENIWFTWSKPSNH